MRKSAWVRGLLGALSGYLVPGYYQWRNGDRRAAWIICGLFVVSCPFLMLLASFGPAGGLVLAYFSAVAVFALIFLYSIGTTARAAYGTPQAFSNLRFMSLLRAASYWLVLSSLVYGGLLVSRYFWLEPFKSPTASQEPSVLKGDRFLADKRQARVVRELRKGDVVLFQSPRDAEVTYVKRVVGMPGETVDGVVVPGDSVFLVGDNRANSFDSRNFGPVPTSLIRGKALMVWISLEPETDRIRFERIGKWIE